MRKKPIADNEPFVIVKWPDCQFFMDDRDCIYLAAEHNAYESFGDSSYFVSLPCYQEVSGHTGSVNRPVYLAVSFPDSQLFIDDHQDEIYLINDENGLEKFGPAAYFIEESLYKKVMADFEKEIYLSLPLNDFNIC